MARPSRFAIAGLVLAVLGTGAACLLPSLTDFTGGGVATDSGTDVVVAPDGGDAASPDAGSPACDPSKPFAPPTPVASLNLAGYSSGSARLSPDELTVYFDADWPGGAGKADLFVATRPTPTSPFGTATRHTTLNTTFQDWDPTITTDGLTLYFGSQRVSPENIFFSTRVGLTDAFPAAAPVPGINGDAGAQEPFVLGNSRVIYFDSKRPGGMGGTDIYRSDGNGVAFAAPLSVPNVNSVSDEQLPVVSDDERLMFLASLRVGGKGDADIYMSRRADTTVAFDVPINVTELNSTSADYPSWISSDGCHILMLSSRADTVHMLIYESRRPK